MWNEVNQLHLKWKEFRALYAADQKTIDLLNQAAPTFFHDLQNVLWGDILLRLCRLTDPLKSAGKDTLSLARLPSVIPDNLLKAKVAPLVESAKQKTDFARDWRNRRLAHKELPPVTGQQTKPLEMASLKHVEEALTVIREAMNCIERHYENSTTTTYERCIEPSGGVNSLLSCLRRGVDAQRR